MIGTLTPRSASSVPMARRTSTAICSWVPSAAGGFVARDGSRILINGPPALADALRPHAEQLAQHVLPSVRADEAELVRSLLADADASIAYVTSPSAARQAVAEIRASAPDVIGLDFETEVLPPFRQPIPIKFTKDGNLAARQPRDGAAGAALDPYRSKVRLVQAWAGKARSEMSNILRGRLRQPQRGCF
jgi:hypothetical protein